MRRIWNRIFGWIAGSSFAMAPAWAFAEEAHGGYRGIAQLYFTFILAILIYGVHDTFKSRNVTIGAAVIMIGVVYVFLLPQK